MGYSMNDMDFKQRIKASIPRGAILVNPGGGTSTIVSYSTESVTYRRGNSEITVSFHDLFNVMEKFKGGRMSSSDLKRAKPSVFDSSARPAGHSCNCTFLFMVLKEIGIVKRISGRGVSGDPFFVVLTE